MVISELLVYLENSPLIPAINPMNVVNSYAAVSLYNALLNSAEKSYKIALALYVFIFGRVLENGNSNTGTSVS